MTDCESGVAPPKYTSHYEIYSQFEDCFLHAQATMMLLGWIMYDDRYPDLKGVLSDHLNKLLKEGNTLLGAGFALTKPEREGGAG